MVVVGVKLGVVGVGFFDDFSDTHDAGRAGVGMVEEDQIALLHTVAHKVTGLVIAYAVPVCFFIFFEIVNGITIGLGLGEPIVCFGGGGGFAHGVIITFYACGDGASSLWLSGNRE